ncbi:putative acetyltransferase, GNAT family [Thozetella sp. PMI_491]|nr:putative acetyltransferase, GNAT family [Thozetella sp. PMI_491]
MPNSSPTPFISLQEPSPLKGWDRTKPSTQQTQGSFPRTFLDAMEVREAVFVEEQGVPQEYEHDDDDPRSCHWVVYASVNRVVEAERRDPQTGELLHPRRSETRTMPIGTVRLVPFPHPPHPRNGGVYVDNKLTNAGEVVAAADGDGGAEVVQPLTADEKARLASVLPFGADRATDMHDGKEPYVKLGRLAVIKEFRGQGISSLLVRTALDWMRKHPTYFNPGLMALGVEQLGMGEPGDLPKWNGLVCCHAQESVIGAWEKCGFKIDQGMGKWTEEGIPHVGMFVRLEIPPEALII